MLESYFNKFRQNIIGLSQTFESPYGVQKIIYADWTASGRMYKPIEDRIKNEIAPFVGNTHTSQTITGSLMTHAYHKALSIIKEHVGAKSSDVIISSNAGMTGVVNKFQRILGLKVHEQFRNAINLSEDLRPIVFISHMEHHSNQTSWIETIADVEIISPDSEGHIDFDSLENLIKKYEHRKLKIASVTACSNVTGIHTDYYKVAEIMHRNNGLCFVDFACSAPYIKINMHPEIKIQQLDAVFFSPHKFLGGPASSGVLVFNSNLYHNRVPDHPGGGTVDWTNPWKEQKYIDDIEIREDGGTPSFIQTIKAALCIKLKEEMGISNILEREEEILHRLWHGLEKIPNLKIMAENDKRRLAIISFYVPDMHYNLIVRLLNDHFGIQTRGGCSCAGTYGHYLLNVSREKSREITEKISHGDFSEKPGWVRISLHPVMTNQEIDYIISSLEQVITNFRKWSEDYSYCPNTNEFIHHKDSKNLEKVDEWFNKKLL